MHLVNLITLTLTLSHEGRGNSFSPEKVVTMRSDLSRMRSIPPHPYPLPRGESIIPSPLAGEGGDDAKRSEPDEGFSLIVIPAHAGIQLHALRRCKLDPGLRRVTKVEMAGSSPVMTN
jgi:hypothetical protein